MSVIRNLTGLPIELDDLAGITVQASSDYNLKEESSNDIANSKDLDAAIQNGNIVFLDTAGNPLSEQESVETKNNISATQPAITIQENGSNINNTPHNVINFAGSGVSVVDAGNGVADVDAFAGLGFSTIDGQQILTLVDSSRGNKSLSVEKMNYFYTKDSVSDNTYLQVSYLTNTSSGYILPMNGTIVGAAMQVRDGNSTTMEYALYVNDSLHSSNLISASSNGENKVQENEINIDLFKDDKIALRADRTSGSSSHVDVNIMLYVRWRA